MNRRRGVEVYEVVNRSPRLGYACRSPVGMMSPELETLDQLQGGDLSLDVVRRLFADVEHFRRGITAMLNAGDLILLDQESKTLPHRKQAKIFGQSVDHSTLSSYRLSLTDAGAARIQ